MTTQTLAPGSAARIYRDGGVLVAQCNVPATGRFEVRGLDPGQYVARDELGGEQAFVVHPGTESTTVSGHGAAVAPGASGMPGTGSVAEAPALHVGPDPVVTAPAFVDDGDGGHVGRAAVGKRVTRQVPNKPADVESVPKPAGRVEPDNDPAADANRVPGAPGASSSVSVPSTVGGQLEEGQNLASAEHAANEVTEKRAPRRRPAAKKAAARRPAAKKK
jgi:hypothetical protein